MHVIFLDSEVFKKKTEIKNYVLSKTTYTKIQMVKRDYNYYN